jgi:cytochrome c-type biogenesis protein CcmH
MAKAIDGPPMPLAVAKLTVSELPAEVKLNDSMAMVPEMRLSKFAKVRVQARIAKSGKPTAESGDLESKAVEAATTGSNRVKLVIDHQVP